MADAKIEYFIERTEKDFQDLKTEMAVIHEKIDNLWSFRSLLLGMAMAISSVVTISINLVLAYIGYKH
jgi:hypothetical protein